MTLTDRQSEMLGFIEGCQRDGYTPTLKEIADHFNMTSVSGVWYQLQQLKAKGFIDLPTGTRRRIVVR